MLCFENVNDWRRPSGVSVIGPRSIRLEANVARMRHQKFIQIFWSGKLKQREHSEDLAIDYKTWKMSPKDIF
jgi:hypothetical protein